jgi:hypothetical protein
MMEDYSKSQAISSIIGNIEPIGETNADNESFENLEEATKIVDNLLYKIKSVADCRDNHQYSMSRSGKEAYEFLKTIASEYSDYVGY